MGNFPRFSLFFLATVFLEFGDSSTKEICQIYSGETCTGYLQNQSVFVPPDTSMEAIEERLKAAYGVIKESKEMQQHCSNYALPSLCFSVLPICRTPEATNTKYAKKLKQQGDMKRKKRKNKLKSTTTTTSTTTVLPPMYEDDEEVGGPPYFDLESLSQLAENSVLTVSRDTENLRRICRTECELLENELCQKEYAIAKRHPTIGQSLSLETCHSLPLVSADCLSLGITIDAHPNETCYTELGMSYRGTKSMTVTGKTCLRWSTVLKEISMYPELAGQNYCRNPGGSHSQPWCYVENEKMEREVELCDIDKCFNEWLSYAMIFAVVLMLICILFIYIICRCTVKKRTVTSIENINLPHVDKNIYGNSRLNSPGGHEMSALMANNLNGGLTSTHIKTQQNCVPHYSLRDVRFVEELGEGAFGKVYKGELTKTNGEKLFVAVKALKENALPKQQQDFRREIELISDLKHDNIVCILGVILNEEPLCMLFEYMVQGDLHEFLIGNSPTENPPGLNQAQFFSIAIQICDGMEFLAAHHYVHRDLAARNCLVGENLTVKISDFGLSRDIYSSDYYRVQTKSLLPVRWMPSEAILYGKFTAESDVWSYGVVLWEIYSYGLQPYYGYSNQEVINMVRARQLLPCPEACPSAVYTLMVECWHEQPIRRPNFTEIGQRLRVWQQSQKKNSNFSGRDHPHLPPGSQPQLIIHSLPRKIPQSCSQHSLNRNGGSGAGNLSLERGRNNAHFSQRTPGGYPPQAPTESASLRRLQQHQQHLQQQQLLHQQQQQQFYHPN